MNSDRNVPPPKSWHPLFFLPENTDSLLDLGCNEGASLEYAHQLGVKKLYGVEINPDAVKMAEKRLSTIHDLKIMHGSADAIPLPEDAVDAIVCSEVLEHVPEHLRAKALSEMARVLRPHGRLILTIPSAGLFAALDPANFRLRFPRLFGVAARVVGGQGREKGYENQKHGIVWHEHFTTDKIRELLDPHFAIEKMVYRGFVLAPTINWLQFPFYRWRKYDHPFLKILNRIESWEMSKDLGPRLGYNLLIVAKHKAS